MVVSGCSDLTGSQPLPAGTSDPATYATPAGARGMRNAAVYQFEFAWPGVITDGGLLTDEFEDPQSNASTGTLLHRTGVSNPLDERILVEKNALATAGTSGGSGSYQNLQSVREFANQAIAALLAYDTVAADTQSVRVMRGELYAMEGYSEIMLADLFCSGVPLSTLDFEHDYTFHASSTTEQVYHDAIAKLDTALVLAAGNDSVMNLARVGRGRAWLNLGQYDSATAAVAAVPPGFQYQVAGAWNGTCQSATCVNRVANAATVSNREGINGLPYISSGDPRSATVSVSISGISRYFPKKYQASLSNGSSPIVIADGIEAQLIRAEVALQAGNSEMWLATLNALRTSGIVDSMAWVDTVGVTPPVYGDSGHLVSQQVDTAYNAAHTKITTIDTINTYRRPVWRAGIGGVSGLYPISDPGNAESRIDTLFTERAMWLFATGHRQGDLRRLLRKYGSYAAFQHQDDVYPTGVYTAPGVGVYGSDVTAPIPASEYLNPLYHGCKNREP
jgi:hypothetical protein